MRYILRAIPLLLLLMLVVWANSAPARTADATPRAKSPERRTQPTRARTLAVRIDEQAAMKHINHLAGKIGPRPTGSRQELVAGDYIARILKESGCEVSIHHFDPPDSRKSRNIIGRIRGSSKSGRQVIIGAHYDTVGSSPGANDNASGVAVMLELARGIPKGVLPFDVLLIGFGAEETLGNPAYVQRRGSGEYAASLSRDALKNIIAMVCLDMVGAGEGFKITNGGNSDMKTVHQLISLAKSMGDSPKYMINATSDHSAFESRGVSAARFRWWPDKHYHRPTDTPDKIDPKKLAISGRLVLRWLDHLSRSSAPK